MYQSKEVKVVLLGDSGVGKSSLLLRFVNNEFSRDGSPTLGAAFLSKTIMIRERAIKFQIWDTAGQEKYKAILPLYYRDAKVAILVYDVTCNSTLDVVKDWVKQLQDSGPQNQIKVILGNKCDLESKVSFDEVEVYAKEQGISVFLTSCKENQGVQEAFQQMGEFILQEQEKQVESAKELNPPMRLTLTKNESKSQKEKGTCC